jgi:hypothetical protein
MRYPFNQLTVAPLLAMVFAVATDAPASAATVGHTSHGTIVINGERAFPLGLSKGPPWRAVTPSGIDALSALSDSGITLYRIGPRYTGWGHRVGAIDRNIERVRNWLTAVAAAGSFGWVNLLKLARAEPGTNLSLALTRVVTTLRTEAGLALWKGADEPWWSGIRPTELRHAYGRVSALAPDNPIITIQAPRGTAKDLRPYSAVTHAHGVDVYPVRFRARDHALHDVGLWTRRLASVTPNQMVFTTLQICSQASFDHDGTGFQPPTRRQERYMIYDAIVNGARGLFFFGAHNKHCFNERDRTLGWNWTFWRQVLRPLVHEVGPRGELYPALLQPGTGSGIRSSNPRVQVMSRRVKGELWVIAASRVREPQTVKLTGLPRTLTEGRRYPSGGKVRLRNGVLEDRFKQWTVRVYRFDL